MCSVGGFIAKEPLPPDEAKRLLQALLYYGETRGQQSSGVLIQNPEGKQKLLKGAITATKFIIDERFDQLFTGPVTLALTHTRQPTCGGTSDEQAHPFRAGHTVVVHNGMINNAKEIREEFSLNKPSGVDSELFAAAINQLGMERLPEVVKKMSGSAAVACVNDGEMFLMRDTSPMEYFTVKVDKNLITVFGSTEHQLLSSIRFNWLIDGIRSVTLPQGGIYPLKADGISKSLGPFSTMLWRAPQTGTFATGSKNHGGHALRRDSENGYYHNGVFVPWSGNRGAGFRSRSDSNPDLFPTTHAGTDSSPTRDLSPTPLVSRISKKLLDRYSTEEIRSIQSDPTICLPHFKLGWGWRGSYDIVQQKTKWVYEVTYGEKQRIKFPELIIKKGGKGKDRNRNGASQGHPVH